MNAHDNDLEFYRRVLREPPVDTVYRYGLWHPERFTLKGYTIEARVRAAAAFLPNHTRKKFVVLTRARSGSTLLRHRLNDHSKIVCEGELLASGKLMPLAFLRALSRKSPSPVYGNKILSYQLAQVQRIGRPDLFMRSLADEGFMIIHLVRHSFWQTLSLYSASASGNWHAKSDSTKTVPRRGLKIDLERFVRILRWNEMLLEYERRAIAGIDFLGIDYDRDLSQPERLEETAKKLFEALGLDYEFAEPRMRKLLSNNPNEAIENYQELRDAIAAAGLSKCLPDG